MISGPPEQAHPVASAGDNTSPVCQHTLCIALFARRTCSRGACSTASRKPTHATAPLSPGSAASLGTPRYHSTPAGNPLETLICLPKAESSSQALSSQHHQAQTPCLTSGGRGAVCEGAPVAHQTVSARACAWFVKRVGCPEASCRQSVWVGHHSSATKPQRGHACARAQAGQAQIYLMRAAQRHQALRPNPLPMQGLAPNPLTSMSCSGFHCAGALPAGRLP